VGVQMAKTLPFEAETTALSLADGIFAKETLWLDRGQMAAIILY
jgi:hypothetical protein